MTNWRVVTLTQPYATLAVLGLKTIETRSRRLSYRGPLLIHAGLGPGYFGSEAALWDFCLSEPCRTVLAAYGIMNPGRLPRGAIVGQVNQIDCVATWPNWATAEPWFTAARGEQTWQVPPPVGSAERAFGDYSPGRWAHLYADARPLATPIPARGQLGLWRWSGELPV
jgi:hypothetical protein